MSSAAELLERQHALVDDFLGVDRSALSAEESHDLMVAMHLEIDRLRVAFADAVEDWRGRGTWMKDGTLNITRALARDTNSKDGGAAQELRRGRGFATMPKLREAVLSGVLSMDHADLFIRHATPRRFELYLKSEERLIEKCSNKKTFDEAVRVVRAWADRADAILGLEPKTPPPSAIYASRYGDGTMAINGDLSPIDAEIFEDSLKFHYKLVLLEDRRNKIQRSPAERRAAALVLMAARDQRQWCNRSPAVPVHRR